MKNWFQTNVRLVVDDVEIKDEKGLNMIKSINMRRNISTQADEISVTIPNINNEYTRLFCGVAERKRHIAVWIKKREEPLLSGTYKKQFEGFLDDIQFNFSDGSAITCNGRDMTAKLLDMKIPKGWRTACKFLPSSAQVLYIAAQVGMLAEVKPTTRVWPASGMWKNVSSVWDVICQLARREGFIAYLNHRGILATTIVFRPLDTLSLKPARVFHMDGQPKGNPLKNVEFSIDRSEAVAKVTVETFDGNNGKLLRVSATPDNAPDDGVEVVITDNSLKDKQLAEVRAKAELQKRMLGMITGQFTVPYTEAVNPEDKIKLKGFDSKGLLSVSLRKQLDGTYFVTDVADNLTPDGSETTINFSAQLNYQVEIESEER